MSTLEDAFGRQLNIGDTVLMAGRIGGTDGTIVDVVRPLTDPVTVRVYWREFGDEELGEEGKVSNHLCNTLNWVLDVLVGSDDA